MISKDKTYRTRDGREVRIYATDGGYTMSVHGAVNTNGVWMQNSWNSEGKTSLMDYSIDLIEVKPRIKRERWVSVHDKHEIMYLSEAEAKDHVAFLMRGGHTPKACVKVVIDCEEGEGL